MTGARKLARDFVLPLLKPGQVVLDLCSGDGWLREGVEAAGGSWLGLDVDPKGRGAVQCDLSDPNATLIECDLAVTCWGLQHLCDDEAQAWLSVRKALKPGGRFVYVGRHRLDCAREASREDPLNGYDKEGLRGLALSTGFVVCEFLEYLYSPDGYSDVGSGVANAFRAILKRRGDE